MVQSNKQTKEQINVKKKKKNRYQKTNMIIGLKWKGICLPRWEWGTGRNDLNTWRCWGCSSWECQERWLLCVWLCQPHWSLHPSVWFWVILPSGWWVWWGWGLVLRHVCVSFSSRLGPGLLANQKCLVNQNTELFSHLYLKWLALSTHLPLVCPGLWGSVLRWLTEDEGHLLSLEQSPLAGSGCILRCGEQSRVWTTTGPGSCTQVGCFSRCDSTFPSFPWPTAFWLPVLQWWHEGSPGPGSVRTASCCLQLISTPYLNSCPAQDPFLGSKMVVGSNPRWKFLRNLYIGLACSEPWSWCPLLLFFSKSRDGIMCPLDWEEMFWVLGTKAGVLTVSSREASSTRKYLGLELAGFLGAGQCSFTRSQSHQHMDDLFWAKLGYSKS